MSITGIIGILISTTLSGSLGAIFLKKGMTQIATFSLKNIATNKFVYLGVFLYILSAITNIVLLNFLDYSIAFPMTSITYIWTVFLSYFMFKEALTSRKIIAVILLMIGVFLLSR